VKNRSEWQNKKYSLFWNSQVVKYGFDQYCKGLCKMVEKSQPSSVYEMAIGTGWPFAITFHEKGMIVEGSDISEFLIKTLTDRYPGIKGSIASYDNINLDLEFKYDLVYCFRSTWYFPDIIKAIDTMIHLAKRGGGIVIFDIMNSDSDYIKNIIYLHKLCFPITILKNSIKIIANFFFKKGYLIQDPLNIHELPVSAKLIEQYLEAKNIQFQKYSINQVINPLDKNFINYGQYNSKIVFELKIP
jgi:SAM-dependent methyltransferase